MTGFKIAPAFFVTYVICLSLVKYRLSLNIILVIITQDSKSFLFDNYSMMHLFLIYYINMCDNYGNMNDPIIAYLNSFYSTITHPPMIHLFLIY